MGIEGVVEVKEHAELHGFRVVYHVFQPAAKALMVPRQQIALRVLGPVELFVRELFDGESVGKLGRRGGPICLDGQSLEAFDNQAIFGGVLDVDVGGANGLERLGDCDVLEGYSKAAVRSAEDVYK